MKLAVPAMLVLLAATLGAQRPAPIRIQISEGIFLYRTAPYGEVGLDGNSIAIIGSDGVLVFDTNGIGFCIAFTTNSTVR